MVFQAKTSVLRGGNNIGKQTYLFKLRIMTKRMPNFVSSIRDIPLVFLLCFNLLLKSVQAYELIYNTNINYAMEDAFDLSIKSH